MRYGRAGIFADRQIAHLLDLDTVVGIVPACRRRYTHRLINIRHIQMRNAILIGSHTVCFAADADRSIVCIYGLAAITNLQCDTVKLVLIFVRDIDIKIHIRANLYAAAAILVDLHPDTRRGCHQQIITVIDAFCAHGDIALQICQIHGAAAFIPRHAVCICADKYRVGVRGAVRSFSICFKGQRVDGIAPVCGKRHRVIAPFFHNILGHLAADSTSGVNRNQHFITVRLAFSCFQLNCSRTGDSTAVHSQHTLSVHGEAVSLRNLIAALGKRDAGLVLANRQICSGNAIQIAVRLGRHGVGFTFAQLGCSGRYGCAAL